MMPQCASLFLASRPQLWTHSHPAVQDSALTSRVHFSPMLKTWRALRPAVGSLSGTHRSPVPKELCHASRILTFRHMQVECSEDGGLREGIVGTSNAIFSPSRSQSNHSMSHWHFLACSVRFLSIAFLSCNDVPTMVRGSIVICIENSPILRT